MEGEPEPELKERPLKSFARSAEFWGRATAIYAGYKASQAHAVALRVLGWDEERIKTEHWGRQHTKAAAQLHGLCIDLRGFYLKVGQFIGARGDFVPEEICRKLTLLHDQVPPMPAAQAREVIERELGVPLEAVFEWIDLDEPLGSASISQVHKGKLRNPGRRKGGPFFRPVWDCLRGGYTPPDIAPGRPPLDMELACEKGPKDGIVAVKVQYPDALPTMSLDLNNIRLAAAFLSKTEINFDLVSAVDELAAQIKLEFDFCREARIMDAVARQFKKLNHRIEVPRSVPGLVTRRVLVMNFLEGIPITRLESHTRDLSAATKRLAANRILSRVSEAYGRMLLLDGLFQADGHPGNILVMKGGKIGLIDYGQSKKLPDAYRAAFAHLVLALNDGDDARVSAALRGVGVVTEREDAPLQARLAYGMFDTRGSVDPFDPNSEIKQMGIETFPPDMFFVLRVVQLLRGLKTGMKVDDFSAAAQWEPYAQQAVKQLSGVPLPASIEAYTSELR